MFKHLLRFYLQGKTMEFNSLLHTEGQRQEIPALQQKVNLVEPPLFAGYYQ